MKKIVFALLAFSSLLVLSCRQQEEMMDSEDLKSLSVRFERYLIDFSMLVDSALATHSFFINSI